MGIPLIRMAGEVRKYIKRNPFAAGGDALTAASELVNTNEPDPIKRAILSVGVPVLGTASSVATGGFDAIPQFAELFGTLGQEAGYPETPESRNVYGCMPLLNTDNYSRLLLGASNSPEIKQKLGKAREFCGAAIRDATRRPRPGGLIMPVR